MTGASPVPSIAAAAAALHGGGRPVLLAVLGPTATGKSALGLELAERHGGEIVSCDSTAVYRGLDIGTDKATPEDRRRVPHHLVDVVEATAVYTAADYARDAASAIRDVAARGRLPILVGGTGFYFRALTRGLFPGPGRHPVLRARLHRLADRRGGTFLHRMVLGVDPESARRIQPHDVVRLVRALEVYFATGRSLTSHFADTVSPLGNAVVAGVALDLARPALRDRVARRVDDQFRRGLLDEVRGLLASGIPPTAHALQGLVYRQVLEHLRGVRDESATRELIVRENVRYARRQLIWFRKEPNLLWIRSAGELAATLGAAEKALDAGLRAALEALPQENDR